MSTFPWLPAESASSVRPRSRFRPGSPPKKRQGLEAPDLWRSTLDRSTLALPLEERGTIVVSRNSFKFVMLPPQTDTTRGWAKRLADAVPEVRVVIAEDADTAAREIADAEAAFGWLSKELLAKAANLRW